MPHIKTIPLTEIIFSNAKLLMAVTFSMIITLTLDCTLAQGQRTNSLFQTIFLDFLRDVSLQARYDYYQGRTGEMSNCLITERDIFHGSMCVIIGIFSMSFAWRYGATMMNHVRAIFLTIWIVELLPRFFESMDWGSNIYYVTIYLLVWQFTSIGIQFTSQQLSSPVMLFEQGLFCILAAILSLAIYDTSIRYLPFEMILLFFWFLSVLDIFLCLRPNGWLRNFWVDIKTIKHEEIKIQNEERTKTLSYQGKLKNYLKKMIVQYFKMHVDGNRFPFVYYTRPQDSDEYGFGLAAGDFLTYNILLLLILSRFSSIITKLHIAFGCIMCINIGVVLTNTLRKLIKQNVLPGVPLPVMIFSTYIVLLDIFINYPDDCVEFSSRFVDVEVEKYLN